MAGEGEPKREFLGARRRVAVALVVAGALLLAVVLLPVNRWALTLVDWIRMAGAFGILVYALAYVGATLLLVPGSLLTAGAGFAYGPFWGTLLVSPVSVLAATVAFACGRSIARRWIARRMDRQPRFVAIDAAVGESGFKLVFLLRLSPVVPFTLLNYALGLTRVRLRDYVLASAVGMLPGTVLYVYAGSLVTSTSALASGKARAFAGWSQAIYWGGLVATVILTLMITRMARRALAQALRSAKTGSVHGPGPLTKAEEPT